MGRISAPFGVRGWLRIQPFTAAPENLIDYRTWWIGTDASWSEHRVEEARVQGSGVVAKLEACDDRDAAASYCGSNVAVPRSAFPAVGPGEFYWSDLVGLAVVNDEGKKLGVVSGLLETGANDVLVLQGEQERLIPFVETVVKEVDLASGVIRVDWGADY